MLIGQEALKALRCFDFLTSRRQAKRLTETKNNMNEKGLSRKKRKDAIEKQRVRSREKKD